MISGRKRGSIWYYFNEKSEIGKKGSRAICKKCGKELQGLVSRLKYHFSNCERDSGNVDDPQQPSTGKCHLFNYYNCMTNN